MKVLVLVNDQLIPPESFKSKDEWENFVPQITAGLEGLIERPLVQQLWPKSYASLRRSNLIGEAIASARHCLELENGLRTLEAPLSQLVSTHAFARFSVQLASALPRFQQVYNSQRDAYRAYHRIRNAAHPVPRLEERDGWLEGPWWV